MLMNKLDPDVSERPDDLLTYGDSGKAAWNWPAYDAIVAALRRLDHARRCSSSPANPSASSGRTEGPCVC